MTELGSVLGLRSPVLEFRILFLGGAMSSYPSHYPQEVLLAQFSLYVHESGLKTHSFYSFISFSNTGGRQRLIAKRYCLSIAPRSSILMEILLSPCYN